MAKEAKPEEERVEIEHMKYGGLTMALGLAAVVGSLALPIHNRSVNELRAGLSIGGLAVMVKGMFELLEAGDRLDKIDEVKRVSKSNRQGN